VPDVAIDSRGLDQIYAFDEQGVGGDGWPAFGT
jgi:hypothetical protein